MFGCGLKKKRIDQSFWKMSLKVNEKEMSKMSKMSKMSEMSEMSEMS